MNLFCSKCHRPAPVGYQPFCSCGALIDVRYDLKQVRLHDSPNPYIRFRDLLPVQDSQLLPDNAVYSPLVHARNLGGELGLHKLYLKNETTLPTGTTKGRQSPVALAFLYEQGVRNFCVSSTGNSSTAFAYFMDRFPDMQLHIFTASDFLDRVDVGASPNVFHHVLKDATFVEAYEFAGSYARMHGLTSERGFFNPGRREGLKLAWLEAADQSLEEFKWYVQAVSSAMGVYGVYKAAKEMAELGYKQTVPRLLCVQQETCSPMVNAWRSGSAQIRSSDIVERPSGIASAILRGDPSRAYPYVHEIVKESRGSFIRTMEEEIREAQRRVFETEGIKICFSAAAAIGGLIKAGQQGLLNSQDPILVNLTGQERARVPLTGREEFYLRDQGSWTRAETPEVI